MFRIFFTLTAFILLSGCSYRYVQMIDTEAVSRAVLIYAEKLKYEYKLDLDDSVVYYDNNINRIRLDFSSMDTIYLADARRLIVDVVEGFLPRINDNMIIAGNLGPAPFGPENLEIRIKFVSFYNKFVDNCTVGMIVLRNGITHIIATDGFICDQPCWQRRCEYYWQSRSFVNSQRDGEALYRPSPTRKKPSLLKDEQYFPVDSII